MSIINKIWNSKTFEVMADVNYEVLKGIGTVVKGVAGVMCDVVEGMCEQSCNINPVPTWIL